MNTEILKNKILNNLHNKIPKGLDSRVLNSFAIHYMLDNVTKEEISFIESYSNNTLFTRYATNGISSFFRDIILPELPYEFNMQLELFKYD